MADKPKIADLLGKGLFAHDMVINLMRALRDRGTLPVDEGIEIMRATIRNANPEGHAERQLQSEIDAWEEWTPP